MPYVKIANLKGNKGDRGVQGAQGPAGTIASAELHSIPAGDPAHVEMSGTQTARHVDFYMPRGLPGLNAVPTDEAVAALAAGEDTALGLAIRARLDAESAVFGVVGVPGTLTFEKLQAAADEAAATGRVLQVGGTLTTDQTLTLKCDFDLTALEIFYTGTTTALIAGEVGVALSNRKAVLPKLQCKTNLDAGAYSATPIIGARLINLTTCMVTASLIRVFDEGLVLEGNQGGFAYNEVRPGHLSGNRRNLVLRPLTAGWVNQNILYGGRWSPSPTFGIVDDPLGAGVLFETGPTFSSPNNNTFINCSFESANRDLYRVDLAGSYNYFLNCRWENPDPVNAPVRVRYRSNALANCIEHGYDVWKIIEVFETGSASNRIGVAPGYMYARAHAVGAAAYPNGGVSTPIVAWASRNQQGATFNAATGAVKPRQGYWRFRAWVHVSTVSPATGYVQLVARFNGAMQSVHRAAPSSAQLVKLDVEFEGYFNGQDEIAFFIEQTTPGDVSLVTSSRFSQFYGALIP